MHIRKGYSDGPEGQIHWRMAEPEGPVRRPDLYCFSPAPLSSIAYATILPLLANDRRVIAPDYPGQGASDGGSPEATIEGYASSMLAAMSELSGTTKVDVMGFHSGTLVAVETALQDPDRIANIVLVDVPAFDAKTRETYLPIMGRPFEPSTDIESLAKTWESSVTKRQQTQSLEECLGFFADTVSAGSLMNATFHAAFTYAVEDKFAAVGHPTAVIATQSSLLEPSRRTAQMIGHASLTECLHITSSVLNQNARETADTILSVLS